MKMQPGEVIGEKLLYRWSRDWCLAERKTKFHFSVGLGLDLGYDFGYLLRFGSEIRVQGR